MKVVLQRVSSARVEVGGRIVGQIDHGLMLLVGIEKGDGEGEMAWMADKVLSLRVFADPENRMNLSLRETNGGILSVSQFTLAGDVRKGRRPDFTGAAEPRTAETLYRHFNRLLAERVKVAEGEFGAMMDVHLVNDGPVTLILEKKPITLG